jgi:hypothetical protein
VEFVERVVLAELEALDGLAALERAGPKTYDHTHIQTSIKVVYAELQNQRRGRVVHHGR